MTTLETIERSRLAFKERLCKECNIPNIPHIGEAEEIIAVTIKADDLEAKQKIKQFMQAHHWVFVENNDRYVPLIDGLSNGPTIHLQEVVYRSDNNNRHKIIINIDHNN